MVTKQIIFPITTKQFLIVIALSVMVATLLYPLFASTPLTSTEICEQKYSDDLEKSNNDNQIITNMCVTNFAGSGAQIAECLKSLKLSPINNCREANEKEEITLRSKFGLADCRFINEKHKLPKYNLEWMAYDIACTPGQSFDVKSPGVYEIEKIGYGVNLGNYIIIKNLGTISNDNVRIVLGHTTTSRKVGSQLGTGDIIGQTDVSGASTGNHVHIELFQGYNNVSREFALGEKYKSINATALLNHRGWDFGQQKKNVYYFTHYDLGDVKQNDNSPCIGASGKDLCYLERDGTRTMALTSDVRKNLDIEFGDRVKLLGDVGCEGEYQVEDEMNKRYREVPGVLRPNTPYYIKGDLPSKEGGACSITKL